jgi:hypothetical protein
MTFDAAVKIGNLMRFEVGDALVSIVDGRTAVVQDAREDGRRGLLRFSDGTEQWFSWAELHQAGKWHEVGGDWYVERYKSGSNRPMWSDRVYFEAVTSLAEDVQKDGQGETARFLAPRDATRQQLDRLAELGAVLVADVFDRHLFHLSPSPK